MIAALNKPLAQNTGFGAGRTIIQRASMAASSIESKEPLNAVLYKIKWIDGKQVKSAKGEKFIPHRTQHAEIKAIIEMKEEKKSRAQPHHVPAFAWYMEINAAPCVNCDKALKAAAIELKLYIQVKITGNRAGYTAETDSIVYPP